MSRTTRFLKTVDLPVHVVLTLLLLCAITTELFRSDFKHFFLGLFVLFVFQYSAFRSVDRHLVWKFNKNRMNK